MKNYNIFNFSNNGGSSAVADEASDAMEQNSAGLVIDTINNSLSAIKKDENGQATIKTLSLGGAVAKSYDKYVIVAVAGQSNSVGYDESALTIFDKPFDENRVFQLGNEEDKEDELVSDVNNTTWTPKIKPLDYCAVNLQKMRRAVPATKDNRGFAGTKGIHLPLANALLDYIPDDYAVLIVPCSYGATSVTANGSSNDTSAMWGGDNANGTGQSARYVWGANTLSSYILQNRIKWALDQNEKNIFAGVIWCQGENDNTNVENNKTGFIAMVNQVNSFLAPYANRTAKGVMDKSLWFVYESTYHYMNMSGCAQVWANYKEFLGESNYVASPRDTDIVNTTAYTSSTKQAHFGVNAFRKFIAPRVANAMYKAGVLPLADQRQAEIIDTSSFVSLEVYDELNKRFSLTEKMLAQYEKSIKALGGIIDKKVQVTSDLLTGFGEFDATQTGITYVGALGSNTFEKYTPEGYDAFYFDNNLNTSTTYGVVVAINKSNGKYLWIYSNDNKVLTNTSVEGGTTFATTPVGATGSKNIIQGNYKIKVVRNGNVFELWRKGINDGDDVEYTKQHEVDITNALDTIGGAENTSYVWGFCVGWSKTLTKVNSDANHWDNVFVEQL